MIFIIGLELIAQLSTSNPERITHHQMSQLDSVATMARQVTVRLVGKYISGSGVIVGNQAQTYYVLTCAHVLEGNIGHQDFQVLTPDGQAYDARQDYQFQFDELDLAVVTFKSELPYFVANLAKQKQVFANSAVYAAGFPNLKYHGGHWHNTFNSGIEYYQFDEGEIAMALPKPMQAGYQLGVSNNVEQGMSGGPLFNSQSELVGIIGRSKYGVGGFSAYQFADGNYPSEEMLEKMQSVSWAIPIDKISHILRYFNLAFSQEGN